MDTTYQERKDKSQKLYEFPQHDQQTWPQLKQILEQLKTTNLSFNDVLKCILEISQIKKEQINLINLKTFYTSLNDQQQGFFCQVFIPKLSNLALKITDLFPQEIPIAIQNSQMHYIFSRLQCACLLANMFFLTLKRNLNHLMQKENGFQIIFGALVNVNVAKIQCLFSYFKTILLLIDDENNSQFQEFLQQKIIFERFITKKNIDDIINCQLPLTHVIIEQQLKIENIPSEKGIKIDFANQFIGGGVLYTGCVQEEIMFTICPEMMVSILFFESMTEQESIFLIGAVQYSQYRGYAWSFSFHSDIPIKEILEHTNPIKLIKNEKNQTQQLEAKQQIQQEDQQSNQKEESGQTQQIQQQELNNNTNNNTNNDDNNNKIVLNYIPEVTCAIDALSFIGRDSPMECYIQNIQRELIKAITGFSSSNILDEKQQYGKQIGVTTGNWGCGAFNGNHQLKFILQWIAASIHQREIIYCTFNAKQLNGQDKIVSLLMGKTVSQLYDIVKEFSDLKTVRKKTKADFQNNFTITLFQFILMKFQ